MQAKAYMERVQRAEEELHLLAKQKEHYMELATGLSVNLDRVGSGSGGGFSSRPETAAVGLADLDADLDKRIAHYTRIVQDAEMQIKKIPQDRFRRFLRLHYLCGLSMRTVSDEMDYQDPKSIYKLRRYALSELAKVLDRPPIID